ncbi:dATP pyrophosphohydrolase [Acidisoma sp.]|uniref:dATP pyrophosphohydrolase n=1 Tax=Acidisoma sp. TaxID=1872115 RepID=UPI003AFFB5B4
MSAGQGEVELIPVRSRGEMRRFISLPDRISRQDPVYVPPLHSEQEQILSTRKNPYFLHAEAQYWLARRGGRDVGRISAQRDQQITEPVGHFGMLAAEDDPAIFDALLRAAEAWHRERGMARISGPYNLSLNETAGVLVEGFDTPPMLLMTHDPRYVGPRLEAAGYAKEKDILAYLYDAGTPLPQSIERLLKRPLPPGLTIRPLDLSRYNEEVRTVSELFNDAWVSNWGFVPLTEVETTEMAKQLRMLLNEKLIWFAEYEGRSIGFIVCLPNVNEAIRDLKGSLLPFGWAKLLWRLKVAGLKSARVPLMGIRRGFHQGLIGSLIPFLLIDAVRREGLKLGFRAVELSWILEDNAPMRRINEVIGSTPYKTYRLYSKTLA